MHNPTSVLQNETHKLQCYLNIQTDDIILVRQSDWVIFNKKEETLQIKTERKRRERDKYLDLVGELKKQWNMKVTDIPIIIGAFDIVTKWLAQGQEELEIRGRVETIQTTALLRSTTILRRVLETCWNLLWETIGYRWCEKLSRSKIIIIFLYTAI